MSQISNQGIIDPLTLKYLINLMERRINGEKISLPEGY